MEVNVILVLIMANAISIMAGDTDEACMCVLLLFITALLGFVLVVLIEEARDNGWKSKKMISNVSILVPIALLASLSRQGPGTRNEGLWVQFF